MSDRDEILNIEDVSKILRIDADTVIELRSGELSGFQINNKWRVRQPDLMVFLDKKVESQRLKSLAEALANPKTWAKAIKSDPDFRRDLESRDFPEGTIGWWLKKASESNPDE